MTEKVETTAIQKTASKTKTGLNLKQEDFCQLYVTGDKELFGNGTECYIEAYDIDIAKKGAYLTARANASRLLTNANIIRRINGLLETGGFNDGNVDKQHLFLINQHADLKTKMGAIKEYNAVKSRVVQKVENINKNVNLNINLDEKTSKQVQELTKALKDKI